jgi:phage tail-like protein
MVRFAVNTHRRAPYKRFNFSVQWDGRPVPGITRVSGLRRTTEPVADRSGGGSNAAETSPGLTSHDPIVLERGRTQDRSFEEWANKVHSVGAHGKVSLKDYKKNVIIALENEAGQQVMAFDVYGCWPSEYTALGDLDAAASGTVTESITLQHDGWERDDEVTEPEEPSFEKE